MLLRWVVFWLAVLEVVVLLLWLLEGREGIEVWRLWHRMVHLN